MSDPAFDVSLTAEGERSMGEGDGGVRGVSSGPLRATTNSTSPRAFCRMLMACWWEMLESSGWPSIARIWSPSRSLPSLQHKNHSSMKHQVRHHGLSNFKSLKKKWQLHVSLKCLWYDTTCEIWGSYICRIEDFRLLGCSIHHTLVRRKTTWWKLNHSQYVSIDTMCLQRWIPTYQMQLALYIFLASETYKQVYHKQIITVPEYRSSPYRFWLLFIATVCEYQYLKMHTALLHSFINYKW